MPRTLAQNAQYIAETIKPAIKSAIEAQGVTVPSTDSFLDYADRIAEIEGGGSGYQLKDLPTGSISTVNDAAPLLLNALKVSVEAWQEGSGDPSPSNVRPIHGWDSGEITVVGKNLCNENDITINDNRLCILGKSYGVTSTNWVWMKKGKYTISVDYGNIDRSTNLRFYMRTLETSLSQLGGTYTVNGATETFELNNDTKVQLFLYTSQTTWNNSDLDVTKVMLNIGETAMPYTPYVNGKQYTHAFTDSQGNPLTVYGAEWDVVSGDLKQTDGYIASYNGESLPSTWISDRDVYASGTTPTTGAEVVYKLATPTTIDLSPLSIRMLQGTNNLYADCGEVIEGEYFSGDNQLYANGIIFAGEGDSGIGSYRKIDALPTDLLNASAMTCEVCARFDSFVNLSSGPYARIITFGDDNQTGRFGPVGLVYDGSSSYDLCVWDDTVDISSGLYEWTPTDTHTVAVVKTTAGTIKIYVDGVLKYTGSSALTITNTLIDYICQRSRYNASYDTQRQINGEIFAWRVYGKELSASQINANFLVDKINYID